MNVIRKFSKHDIYLNNAPHDKKCYIMYNTCQRPYNWIDTSLYTKCLGVWRGKDSSYKL